MNLKIKFQRLATTLTFGLLLSAAAHASAPQQMTQAPGFYRMKLGDFEITALSDGTSPLPVDKLLVGIAPTQIDSALDKWFLKAPLETSTNAFLINTGAKLILVDTGFGRFFGPTQGKMLANLKAAGYRPEQIDEIYITHMHGDHVGGLLVDGKVAFPNAIVRASQQESDFWLSAAHLETAPEQMKGFFQAAMSAIKPYEATGRFKTFSADTELSPGIRAKLSAGHTPGHTVYEIESGGQKLMLWGDLVHVAAVQFADPSVTIRFDSASSAAALVRKAALLDASEHGYWVAGAHIAFPGIGHVLKASTGFEFVPASYRSVP